MGDGDPGRSAADHEAGTRGAEPHSDGREVLVKGVEARRSREGLRDGFAGTGEQRRNARAGFPAQFAGAACGGNARGVLSRERVEPACDFAEAELALLFAE
jgi:hypothetical protein